MTSLKVIFDSNPEYIKPLIRQLERKLISIGKLVNQLEFLLKCKKHQVLPPTLAIKRKFLNDRAEERLLKITELKLLSISITRGHQQRKILNSDMVNGALHLYNGLSHSHFHDMWVLLEEVCSHYVHKHKLELESKFSRLQKSGSHTKPGLNKTPQIAVTTTTPLNPALDSPNDYINPSFVNLSSYEFTADELTVLDKGSNFALDNPNMITIDSICKLSYLTKGNDELTSKLAVKIDHVNNKSHSHHQTAQKNVTILRDMKDNKNLQLTKADKGGKIVALDKTEYNQKLSNIVKNNYQKIKGNPTRKIVNHLRNFLKQELNWEAKYVEFLIPSAPNIPCIFGQPKLQKEGAPLRPIISQKGSCFSELGKKLSKELFDLIKRPSSHVKNGKAFVDICHNRPAAQVQSGAGKGMLVSLDVVDMFTSIDPNKAILALSKKLDTINESEFRSKLNMTKTQCLILIRYFLDNNYFKFEENYYTQRAGLAMGSSLSPLLADLVMEEMELQILDKYKASIAMFWRYVDDIFLHFLGQETELDDLLNYANHIDPNIQFTMEKEINQTLNFLDVTVKRNIDGTFRTTLYKKPTSGDGLIHFESGHPNSLKVNTARQHLRRIEHICSDERDKTRERYKLKQALIRLKYDNKSIYKIFAPLKLSQQAPAPESTKKEGRYVVLQYQPEVRRCVGDQAQLRQSNIAWGQQYGILNALRHRKLPTKNLKLSNAIYAIPCSCGAVYIGETKRQVFIRLKEHQAYFRRHDINSKIVLHLDEFPDHVMQWDNAFILDLEPNAYFRKLKETAYIEVNANKCISDVSISMDKNWIWILRTHSKRRRHYNVYINTLCAL